MENNSIVATGHSKVQDFFLYLFCMICLYVSSISFINLVYAIISKYFGDVLFDTGYSTSAKVAIASLVIFFPIYIWLSGTINKSIVSFPEAANLTIRKILYYFTLFVAGLVIAVDLVTLIFYFLDGEITVRFNLKVLTILFVGGIVFGYYLFDLRRDATKPSNKPKIYAIVASVVVLAALVLGFVVSGSPFKARLVKFDNQRVNDLSSIQYAITDYYRANSGILPENLTVLQNSTSYYISNIKDPENNSIYEYLITSTNKYLLCAMFSTDSSTEMTNPAYYGGLNNFRHGIGRVCFDRIAGEILPVVKPVGV